MSYIPKKQAAFYALLLLVPQTNKPARQEIPETAIHFCFLYALFTDTAALPAIIGK